MLSRRESAQERMLAGLVSPVIRDVVTVRKFVSRTVDIVVLMCRQKC